MLYSSVQQADREREYVHSIRYRLRTGPNSYALYVQRDALPQSDSVPPHLFMRFAVERDD
jgi:hypothetical protein